ncbi:gamma-glutamyltranspeptidase 2 [Nannizzia gypsea CBS 118893]|uniref:Glutathione hydrolase n=1 Tax=Arthroderma gypseum (strain ATCC MYA-4604 / CBS 118893) TaxID=535722 RepID=E4V1V8_ARTGP|nr:gamma-glutamyltranspeptidase 2 [Nannizzia gypsea CBS 118893]EFR04023.1 gamma-glutamyltranspeptidase 2 [Nannizzia gypsea CBS 118893]
MSRWIVPTSVTFLLGVLLLSGNSMVSNIHFPNVFGWHRPLLTGKNGAVVSAGDICSRVGTSIILRGGNAVDAAVATDFCLGVTHPWIAGLGGGGYAIVRDASGNAECVDFREAAPAASDRDMFNLDANASISGGLASGIPGELRGLDYLHRQYGKMSWKEVIAPAIKVARGGFSVNQLLFDAMSKAIKNDGGDNFFVRNADWAEVFAPKGTMLGVGDVMKMERYADLLELVATNGTESFYAGPTATKIADTVKKNGGIMTTQDFQAYQIKRSAPIEITYGNYKIKACRATSGGTIVLMTMNAFHQFPDREDPNNVNLTLHRLVEAMRFGYAARATLGDPDFNPGQDSSEARLIQQHTADEVRAKISDMHTLPVEAYNPEQLEIISNHGTSHLSAADASGMAISLTSTPNLSWGSKLMIPGLGLIMNNGMDDFSVPNRSNHFGYIPTKSNFIAPLKRALSSMSPVIVDHIPNSSFYLATGGAGGSHIISGVEQMLWRLLDLGSSAKEAIDAPRFHDQLIPNVLNLDQNWDNGTFDFLKELGHDTQWGNVGVDLHVLRLLKNGTFEAAAESRIQGSGGFAV